VRAEALRIDLALHWEEIPREARMGPIRSEIDLCFPPDRNDVQLVRPEKRQVYDKL